MNVQTYKDFAKWLSEWFGGPVPIFRRSSSAFVHYEIKFWNSILLVCFTHNMKSLTYKLSFYLKKNGEVIFEDLPLNSPKVQQSLRFARAYKQNIDRLREVMTKLQVCYKEARLDYHKLP